MIILNSHRIECKAHANLKTNSYNFGRRLELEPSQPVPIPINMPLVFRSETTVNTFSRKKCKWGFPLYLRTRCNHASTRQTRRTLVCGWTTRPRGHVMKRNVPVVCGRVPAFRIRVAASGGGAGKTHRVPAAAAAGDGPFGRRVATPQRVRGRRPLPMMVVAVRAHRGPSASVDELCGRVSASADVAGTDWTTTTTSAAAASNTVVLLCWTKTIGRWSVCARAEMHVRNVWPFCPGSGVCLFSPDEICSRKTV